MREQVYNRSQLHQERIKKTFDKHSKKEDFQMGDLVLKWDTKNEDKGKHENSIISGWVHSESVHIVGTTFIF
jgi:hypothetical protein